MLEVSNDIRLRVSNLYRNGEAITFINFDRELIRTVYKWKGNDNDRFYTVRNPDYLDRIAWKVYSDFVEKAEWFWWVLADANNIENPLDLSELVGKDIVIPDIQLFLLLAESVTNEQRT